MKTYFARSLRETQKLARDFAKTLQGGEVVALRGQLGSGKTTFVRAVAKTLKIKAKITSPTFVICNRHLIKAGKMQGKFLYHLDLYRLRNPNELDELGIKELINDKKNILFIEWPENAGRKLGRAIKLNFLMGKNKNERKITLKRP